MKTINYQTLQETLYFEEMDNGLKVYLLPKKGFSKTYGLFSTCFGSIDTTFVPIGENEMLKVPDGIAHFLEHKMFEMEDGDASDGFARLGASTNAFTSSSRTAYLFSTTTHEDECIELLLDFVQDIYLTEENVEKEKGIINQEIGMYDDDPDWRCYFGSIQNLYQNHPVKIDIAGTVDTVREIDKDTLEKCYHTFYHPSNMMLFVVGNIDPQKTMTLIRENQAKKHFEKENQIQRENVDEPQDVDQDELILNMDVVMPKLIVSMKINDILTEPSQKLKRELSMNLLLDLLFAKSSKLYEDWMRQGFINDSFSANFTQERNYSFLQIGGDTQEPEKLRDKIYELIESIDSFEIDEADFQRVQKKNIGILIGVFNSPESIANMFSRYYFEGIMIFDLIDCLASLSLDDVNQLKSLFDKKYLSTCMIKPKENGQ
ncbi:MAG: pitrilysin family protein [Longibaculum muris]|mgnify:FL=1|uniref:Putative Zn-dependent peptidase n=1 Tax=Longibaculum muris TaxID=1796628 RepID=A0A4R3YHZ5_9FIRM|nr:pitrilysin family protein [Longibaculum muris]KXU52238.1 peptidase M16 inactive domain protein [Candidatus Stoquefichus sp. KLE1796]MBS5370445.1 insulinase family protein [Coprobacillus cateniformis]MCR1889517.1 insulinase family protein [Longibaculum muris]MED9813183.1 pitrilysin family protein [Longibaculum muris]TCV90898.1 putative Zn-dependent peptidase [Longibaculum muris]